jgi:mannose PTS system EIID component
MRIVVPRAGVSSLPPRLRRALLLRSFLAQGSWNYETLIGTGFAFVLLPVLRHVYRSDPDAFRAAVLRHMEVFNSHPYLTPLAAGAIARLELEGTAPEVITRFKDALRSSLGALGDQLVWLSWRPAAALLAIALLLFGLPWWLAVGAFLVSYNLVHLWLRIWGLRRGLEEGLGVGRVIREAPLASWGRRAVNLGAFLAGVCSVLAIARAGDAVLEISVAALLVAAGLWLGLRLRRPAFAALVLVWVAGLAIGFTS